MLGDYIYSADVSGASYKSNNPQKFEKWVKHFLVLAVIFVCGGLIWIFCISPCMVPVKTDVKGFPGFEKADILHFAGIGSRATYVSVNAAEVEQLLSSHYLVESARVVKRFPDRLAIFLEPRRAVAMVYANLNGRTQPVYFDRYGVAIGVGRGAPEVQSARLPIVSGVLDDSLPVKPGMKIAAAYLPLFARIGAISDADPSVWQVISEIGIAHKEDTLYDLLLYPVHDSIKLRMRSDISKDSIYYALLMFDVYRQSGSAIPREIDVRSGIGVINTEEARFGK